MAAAAEAKPEKQLGVTIAIVDDGGICCVQRLDGAAAISAQIAPAKANRSAGPPRKQSVRDVINVDAPRS